MHDPLPFFGFKTLFAIILTVGLESDVFYITSECLDDGILDPRETRDVLGFCYGVIHNTMIEAGGLYGVSRL